MAVRYDAAGDYLSFVGDHGLTNFTYCGWSYLSADRNTNGAFYQIFDATATNNIILGVNNSGTQLRLLLNSSDAVGTNLSIETWYHVALVKSGTSFTVYLNGVSDITATNAISFTIYALVLNHPSSWVNARQANASVYANALTQAQVQQNMRIYRPALPSNPWAWWPILPGATERLRDYSGNGRNLTANGTLTDEDGPGIGWGASPLFLPYAAPAVAGGQPMAKRILTVPHLAGSRRIGAF